MLLITKYQQCHWCAQCVDPHMLLNSSSVLTHFEGTLLMATVVLQVSFAITYAGGLRLSITVLHSKLWYLPCKTTCLFAWLLVLEMVEAWDPLPSLNRRPAVQPRVGTAKHFWTQPVLCSSCLCGNENKSHTGNLNTLIKILMCLAISRKVVHNTQHVKQLSKSTRYYGCRLQLQAVGTYDAIRSATCHNQETMQLW